MPESATVKKKRAIRWQSFPQSTKSLCIQVLCCLSRTPQKRINIALDCGTNEEAVGDAVTEIRGRLWGIEGSRMAGYTITFRPGQKEWLEEVYKESQGVTA